MSDTEAKFQEDINRVWTSKLINEFHKQNAIIDRKLNNTLNCPNFELIPLKQRWGEWEASTNTLRLSYHLLKNYEWVAVVETLKHEMAHMIVSELWSDIDNNGNSHGELFKKACAVLNLDESSSKGLIDKSEYYIPENERIVDKIHKLFCLGESNYKEEAKSAVMKAEELMIKYNVSMRDLPKEKRVFIFRPIGNIYKKVPSYVQRLARIISEYYFVKHIYITHWANHRRSHYIEIYGEISNVNISEYIFHFLLMEGERQWEEFKKSEAYQKRFDEDMDRNFDTGINDRMYRYNSGKYRKGKYSKVAFLDGLYSGFENKLYKEQESVIKKIETQNTLPICIEDPLLTEKYEEHYHPVSWHSNGGSSRGGHKEGRAIGERITIRQGVTRNYGSGIRMLT